MLTSLPSIAHGASDAPTPIPWRREDLEHYQRTIANSVKLRSHLEILVWLQGDMQRYLPHDILIAAWGDFETGNIRHDIVSIVSGWRSNAANDAFFTPLLVSLYAQWIEQDKKAMVHAGDALKKLLELNAQEHVLNDVLRGMHCILTHGIKDERGSHDSLYLVVMGQESFDLAARTILTQVLPYIDHALRQVEHLPHQHVTRDGTAPILMPDHVLSPREREILQWIALGKTNSEIGSILGLTVYTVKNSVQHIFRSLNVSNRAQAVALLARTPLIHQRPSA